MVVSNYITATLLLLFTLAVHAQNATVEYNVIALLNQTTFKSMAVVVDNVSYALESNATFPIIYSTTAPVARTGYQYVKLYSSNDSSLAESFTRLPTTVNTPHEFFNRSWNTHDNYQLPQVYPMLSTVNKIQSDLHKDNQIPTIHLIGNQTELDEMNTNSTADITVKVNMTYISLTDALQFEKVKVKVSGHSTRNKDKISYKLKLKKKHTLYGYRTVKLRAMAMDSSYVREQLAYDVIKSAGLISTGTSYVRVFMNEQELGLFGLIEHFQNPWLANTFANGSSSYENGYLYGGVFQGSSNQSLTSDLSYYNNVTLYADGEYKMRQKASGGSKTDFEPLQNFTKFIDEAPTNSTDAVNIWKSSLDTDSFLRSLALEILIGNGDGYLSMANNYYVYQNPATDNFMWISCDMDLTLGNKLDNLSNMWSGNYSTWTDFYTRPLSKKIVAVPEFKQTFEEIIQNLTAQVINPNYTYARIDSLVDMIRQDVEWDQTCTRVHSTSSSSSSSSSNGGGVPQMTQNQTMSSNQTMSQGGNATAMQGGGGGGGGGGPSNEESVSFEDAVNGTTASSSSVSVKLWLQGIYQNTTSFYSQN